MKPKKLFILYKVLDLLMVPIMYLLAGTFREKPQETHIWHTQQLNQEDIVGINFKFSVTVEGNDSSRITSGTGFYFHIPIFGGWRNYVVLEVQSPEPIWHIGWIVRDKQTNKVKYSHIHKLPITDNSIRLLTGTPDRVTAFFALNSNGTQLPLIKVGSGMIGEESEFSKVRLF